MDFDELVYRAEYWTREVIRREKLGLTAGIAYAAALSNWRDAEERLAVAQDWGRLGFVAVIGDNLDGIPGEGKVWGWSEQSDPRRIDRYLAVPPDGERYLPPIDDIGGKYFYLGIVRELKKFWR